MDFSAQEDTLVDILRGVFQDDLNSYQAGDEDSATHSSIVSQVSAVIFMARIHSLGSISRLSSIILQHHQTVFIKISLWIHLLFTV